MKKTFLCGAILTAGLLSACSDAPQNTAIELPNVTIGATISSIETNPFFQGAYKSMQTMGEENSQITILLDSANNNQQVQYEQLDSMKNKGAKAFVINLADVAEGEKLIQKYCGQVPLVFFNRNPGDKALAKCEQAYFVDGDASQAGVLQGLQILEQWKKHPEWDKNKDGTIQYALVEGIPNHAGAMARSKWAIGTLQNYPVLGVPVQKIFTEHAMFQTAMAKEVVGRWVAQPQFAQVEVLFTNNDSMAIGAIQALKEANVKVPVFGIDGTNDALNAIKAGDMVGTVFNDYDNQAKVAVRMAANLAAGLPVMTGIEYQMHYKVVQVPYQNIEQNEQK